MVHVSCASAHRSFAVLAVAFYTLSCTTERVEERDSELDDELIEDDDVVGAGYADQHWSRSRGRIPYEFNGVPWLGQFQRPWRSLRYGDDPNCSTYEDGGCGPTAFAMVLRHYSHSVTPDEVGSIAVENGARRCPGGTHGFQSDFLNALTSAYGVNATLVFRDHERVLGFLRVRQPVIAIGSCRGYTARREEKRYPAHYLVLTGEDVIRHHGKWRRVIRVNDPGKSQGAGIAYMTFPQFRRMGRFIHLAPTDVEQPAIAFAPSFAPSFARSFGGRGKASEGKAGHAFTRCDRSALRTRQRFLESGMLGDDEWVDYGRALAACDPRDRPWEAVGAGDRERFLDEYVIPFVNGDAMRGSPFQRHEPRRYTDLVRAWKLEG